MTGYRLYFLVDERIKHAVTFDCGTDADAIRTVQAYADGRAMELWTGARMVRRFTAGEVNGGGQRPPGK